MNTDMLIRQLAEDPADLRPLAAPWMRALRWLAIAAPAVCLLGYVMLPKADLLSKLSTPRYLSEGLFAMTTGVLAAIAAFASTVPGYDRKVLALPLTPLALWLSALGVPAIRQWLQVDPHAFSLAAEWFCLPAIAMVGAVPAVAMTLMLRRGAPMTPHVSVALGGLASAGLGNVGVCLSHPQFSGLPVLVWHLSAVCFLSMVASSVGPYLFNWPATLARTRRQVMS